MTSKSKQDQKSKIRLICAGCGKEVADKARSNVTRYLSAESRCACRAPELVELKEAVNCETQEPGAIDEDVLNNLGDKYEVLGLLGKGGMGAVYKVRDRELNETFAIKVLNPKLVDDKMSVKRFEQEVKAASNLTHANICAVYSYEMGKEGTPYLVMDSLVGANLADIIAKESFLDVPRALDIFIQTTEALSHAHMKGVVHRDVKPENINANMDNSVLIKDFLVDAGIKALDADNFIQDLIVARKHDTSGCTREMLAAMMSKHKLDAVLEIYGHSHLVLKGHNNQARSSTRPILTVLDSSAKNKQTRAVDDMQLGVKLGYKFSKPLIVASNVSDVVSTSSTVALDKSGQKHDILPTSSPALVSQTSKDGLFGITRRKEETDSFAFISTAANTDTSEDEESVKDKVTTTPSIKVNGS